MFVAMSSVVLTSCLTVLTPDYYYNEIVLRNETNRDVTDVTIKVKNTGGVFSCSVIPARAKCSNKIRKRKYQGNPITIKWRFAGQNHTEDQVQLTVPENFSPEIPLRGVLVIENDGKIKTYFEQGRP